jgi:hypothetical protein
MDAKLAASAVEVIRKERDARLSRLSNEDPDYAYDSWLFFEGPFIGDLCLTVLVAVHHQVERELLHLAARVADDGRDLSGDEFDKRVEEERGQLKDRSGRKKLVAKLKLETLDDWHSLETLRFLSNSYKHNPSQMPDEDLLRHLGLKFGVPYAPLSESEALRAALGASLGLSEAADFCDIADELISRAARCITDAPDYRTT